MEAQSFNHQIIREVPRLRFFWYFLASYIFGELSVGLLHGVWLGLAESWTVKQWYYLSWLVYKKGFLVFHGINKGMFKDFLSFFISKNFKKLCFLKKLLKNTHNIKYTILTIFIIQFSSVKYIHIIVQLISTNLFSCKTETLNPLNNSLSF